ncbi:hypothetical protein D3C87_38210 [compost metagenome]
MGQEDYLKRQLDQLGQVLAKMLGGLLGLKNNQSLNDGIEHVNQALKAELGFTSDEFAALPDDEFIRILESDNGFRNPHFEKLADLFLFLAENTPDSAKQKSLFAKSLLLYKHLEQTESTYSPDRHAKVERISRKLNGQ